MPLLVDPDHDRAFVFLRRHERLPLESRPLFVVRNMSGRGRRAYFARLDALSEIPQTPEGNREYYEQVMSLLKEYVVGWKRVTDKDGNPIPFSIQALEDETTAPDLNDLAYRIPSAIQLDEDVLGESTSPAPTATEQSAKDAQDQATVPATT